MFGNLDEVLHVSAQLILLIELEVEKSEDSIRIGQCLLNCAEEMQQFYAIYCQNNTLSFGQIKKVSFNLTFDRVKI